MAIESIERSSPIDSGLVEQLSAEALFNDIQLNGIFEKGIADAYVPLYLINDEEVPVDKSHVWELADQIRGRAKATGQRGQLEHIFLGYIPGLSRLVIVDGFHRVPALRLADHNDALARILLNTDWEEITDLRIVTAREHKSVSFSREVRWIEDTWARTDWADKISAVQAFGLEQSDANTPGAYLKISPEEVAAIRGWTRAKSSLWKLETSTISNHLALASAADPGLVKVVRGGRVTSGQESINQSQFKAIVLALPHNFPLQRVAYEVVKKNNLSPAEANSLAWAIAPANSPEEARGIILNHLQTEFSPATPSPSRVAHYYPSWRRRTVKRIPEPTPPLRPSSPELLENFFVDELKLAYAALEIAVLRGRYVAPPINNHVGHPRLLPVHEVSDLGIEGREGPKKGWDEDKITAYLELLQHNLPERLAKLTSFDSNEKIAASIVKPAVERLLHDIRNGGLRYVQLDDRSQIDRLLVKCVVDEAKLREVTKLTTSSDGSEPDQSLVQLFVADAPEISIPPKTYIKIIRRQLPQLSPMERQTLILSTFFDLSALAIGQVLDKNIGIIEPMLVKISRKVRQETLREAKTLGRSEIDY